MEESSYMQGGRCLGFHKFSEMLEGLLRGQNVMGRLAVIEEIQLMQ